jgi:hypothetical protein
LVNKKGGDEMMTKEKFLEKARKGEIRLAMVRAFTYPTEIWRDKSGTSFLVIYVLGDTIIKKISKEEMDFLTEEEIIKQIKKE